MNDAYKVALESMATRLQWFRQRIDDEIVTLPDRVSIDRENNLYAYWERPGVSVKLGEGSGGLRGAVTVNISSVGEIFHQVYDFPKDRDTFREDVRPYLTLKEQQAGGNANG